MSRREKPQRSLEEARTEGGQEVARTLREVAFTRSGDKGDISNIGVVPYRAEDLGWLKEQVTEDRVRALFAGLVQGRVTRYELPGISALNFVLENALSGGVSRSLNLDAHGKSWASLMLSLSIQPPDGWVPGWGEAEAGKAPARRRSSGENGAAAREGGADA